MRKALYQREDIEKLSRKGGRELSSIDDYMDKTIQRLEEYAQRNTYYCYQKQKYQQKELKNSKTAKSWR